MPIPLTAANLAAARKKRKEDEARLAERRKGLGKESTKREEATDKRLASFAKAAESVERKAAEARGETFTTTAALIDKQVAAQAAAQQKAKAAKKTAADPISQAVSRTLADPGRMKFLLERQASGAGLGRVETMAVNEYLRAAEEKAAAAKAAAKPSIIDKIKEIFAPSEKGLASIQAPGAKIAAQPVLPIVTGIVGGGITAVSAVARLAKVGTSGLAPAAKQITTASKIAANTKTAAQTQSWLAKLFTTTKRVTTQDVATGRIAEKIVTTKISPLKSGLVATAILGAIGSYPFAGFIKEEALQTLGFGVNSAIRNNDIEGAELAIAEQKEILDPSFWDKIIGAVPYANVVAQLKDFYGAAETKLAVDERVIADMKQKIETGETEEQYWARVNANKEASEIRVIDHYNQQRILTTALVNEANAAAAEIQREATAAARKEKIKEEAAARTAGIEAFATARTAKIKEEAAAAAAARAAEVKARNADAAFWAKEAAKQRQYEAEDRKAIADFWTAYRKTVYQMQLDSRPSNLNFGLL